MLEPLFYSLSMKGFKDQLSKDQGKASSPGIKDQSKEYSGQGSRQGVQESKTKARQGV